MAQFNFPSSVPSHSSTINTCRQRSASPNANNPLENTTRQNEQADQIIAYRIVTDGVLCRNLTKNIDVIVKKSSFNGGHDYNRTIPGYEIIQSNSGNVVPGRVASAVVEGFGRIASISNSAVIVVASGRRYRAEGWAFPNDNSTVDVGMELHFEALPPNKRDGSDRSTTQKKQSSLPMIIKAHARSDCCSTVLRHRPQHWISHNTTSSPF